jgi:spore coat protein H
MPLYFHVAAFVLWACVLQPNIALSSALPDPDKRARNDALFTNGIVRRIQIEIGPAELASLKKEPREFVSANFRDGANVFTNIGLHLKGVGTFRPIDQKPSFSLKFNKFVPGQEFFGLSKIALNNSVQDPSYVNEAVCTELFRSLGVPAARTTHAWVNLNGRDLGLYVLVEGINKDFLRRHFKSDSGNLYEGYTQDITEELDQDNGKELTQADVRALAKAANEPNSAERWLKLEKLLDIDRFISMMAGEIIMSHWDGYWINRNNYRIYHDTSTGRMVMFPHGLDNMWQQTDLSWRPTMSGLLTRALLMTSDGQKQYREKMSAYLTNYFQVRQLTNRVNEIAGRLRPEIQARTSDMLGAFDREVSVVRERIVKRIANLSDQLKALTQPVVFDRNGASPLNGWRHQIDGGDADFREAAQTQKTCYVIKQKGNGGCIASWRARAVLEPGRYRFEGRVKTVGLMPPDRADTGLMLRISGEKVAPQITRDADWRTISYDFGVTLPSHQIELVCELACLLGEAWIDRDSLRLVRLQ